MLVEFLTEPGDLPLMIANLDGVDGIDASNHTRLLTMNITEYQKGKYTKIE